MRVLSLCTYDRRAGGAAEVAWRLFHGLRDAGAESRLLVQQKFSHDHGVMVAGGPFARTFAPFRFHVDALPLRLGYPHRRRVPWSPAWLAGPAPRAAQTFAPDVIHVHWAGHGFVSIRDLARLPAPVVWTLHDAWAFTGGCHVPEECPRYREACGACPQLGSSNPRDLSRRVWEAKRNAWAARRPTLVAPSRWMADCARSSPLFAGAAVEVIPNGLDTERFQPRPRAAARARFNLPPDRPIVLCSAFNARRDPRKGFDLLVRALAALPDEPRRKALLVVAGDDGAGAPAAAPGVETRWMGRVDDAAAMAALYSAADVLAVPSRTENHSCAIAEGMACGRPVVAFDVGGNRDLVAPDVTGALAPAEDAGAFGRHLAVLLADAARREACGRAARETAVRELGMDLFVKRHLDLYHRLTGVSPS